MSHRVLASVALVAIATLPFGAIAFAQPVPVPDDPGEPYPPAAPPPIAEPAPVVIVNPPPRATVISTEPAYETVEDQWNAPCLRRARPPLCHGGASPRRHATRRSDRWAERLYVPVVGPWLALNDHGDCPIERPRAMTRPPRSVARRRWRVPGGRCHHDGHRLVAATHQA
jgi:hypothetical protein